MGQIDMQELKNEIKTGKFCPVYCLWGEEKLLLKRAANSLVGAVVGESMADFNLQKFSSDSSVDSIADAALSLPFFSERKCVVVTDLEIDKLAKTKPSEIKKLYELLSDLSDMTVLIFQFPTLEFDIGKGKDREAWQKFINEINKRGETVKFENMSLSALADYMDKLARGHSSSIDRSTAYTLMNEYIGTDLNRVITETEKLSAFCEGRAITKVDIEKLCSKTLESNIYDLQKKIIASNYDEAYTVLHGLFEAKEKASSILSVLSDSYVDIYRAKAARKAGKKATSPAEYEPQYYKRKEWRLESAERNGKNLSDEQLRRTLSALLEADSLIKSSRMDENLIVEELIAKLLLITKGEDNGWKRR